MSENGIYNNHYKVAGVPEPWDFMKSGDPKKFSVYLIGNVFKYLFRAGKKNGEGKLKDLEKTKAYLDELIDLGYTQVSYTADTEKTFNWLVSANPPIQALIAPSMDAEDIRLKLKLYIISNKPEA